MRFQIDPTPGETQRACSALATVSLRRSRANLWIIALYAAIILAASFLTRATLGMSVAIAVGSVVATVVILQVEGRSRLSQLTANDPHALETHFIELSPEGIRCWCAHVDARYSWPDFFKVTENQEFVLFARRSGTGAAIPKRLLHGPQDLELRNHIREWAPDHGASLGRDGP